MDLFKHAAGKGAPGEQELTLEGARKGWRESSLRRKIGAIVMFPFL